MLTDAVGPCYAAQPGGTRQQGANPAAQPRLPRQKGDDRTRDLVAATPQELATQPGAQEPPLIFMAWQRGELSRSQRVHAGLTGRHWTSRDRLRAGRPPPPPAHPRGGGWGSSRCPPGPRPREREIRVGKELKNRLFFSPELSGTPPPPALAGLPACPCLPPSPAGGGCSVTAARADITAAAAAPRTDRFGCSPGRAAEGCGQRAAGSPRSAAAAGARSSAAASLTPATPPRASFFSFIFYFPTHPPRPSSPSPPPAELPHPSATSRMTVTKVRTCLPRLGCCAAPPPRCPQGAALGAAEGGGAGRPPPPPAQAAAFYLFILLFILFYYFILLDFIYYCFILFIIVFCLLLLLLYYFIVVLASPACSGPPARSRAAFLTLGAAGREGRGRAEHPLRADPAISRFARPLGRCCRDLYRWLPACRGGSGKDLGNGVGGGLWSTMGRALAWKGLSGGSANPPRAELLGVGGDVGLLGSPKSNLLLDQP